MGNEQQGSPFWYKVDESTRRAIKELALGQLISTEFGIRSNAGQIISNIFALELPHNGWNDLIHTLMENCNNANISIKKAAIMTLGYICDKLVKTPSFSKLLGLKEKGLVSFVLIVLGCLKKTEQDEGTE